MLSSADRSGNSRLDVYVQQLSRQQQPFSVSLSSLCLRLAEHDRLLINEVRSVLQRGPCGAAVDGRQAAPAHQR